MTWCLRTEYVDKFKNIFSSGEVTPRMLADMSTKNRNELFKKVGDPDVAKHLNTLYEEKALLKLRKSMDKAEKSIIKLEEAGIKLSEEDKSLLKDGAFDDYQKAFISFVSKTIENKPALKRDIISRIERMDKNILDPKSESLFMQDLAEKKLGISPTFEQVKKITALSKSISDAKEKDMTVLENRIDYGLKIFDMQDYLHEISGVKMSKKDQIINFLNLPRTLMTTFDLSAPLRQGWGMISRPEWYKSFVPMLKMAVNENEYQKLMADIVTRETYPLMKQSKLRITKISHNLTEREEAYMTTLLDKFPIARGSERAYLGFLNKLRADVFDSIYKEAVAGGHLGKSKAKDARILNDIAEVVNNFTGAGNIGRHDVYGGSVPLLNNIFFSPRKTMASINMFNPAKYFTYSAPARKNAIRQILGSLSITATLLSLARLGGAEVEVDPRSSDFGKAKIGNTRVDFTGGNASYVTLLSRIALQSTKSTTTDLISEYGTGFGQTNSLMAIRRFERNKFNPMVSLFVDVLAGENSVGDKVSGVEGISSAVLSRIYPMVIQDTIESATNSNTGTALLTLLPNVLGASVQSYSYSDNWDSSTSKEMKTFRKQVTKKNFIEANRQYNASVQRLIDTLNNNQRYLDLTEEEKKSVLYKEKRKIKKEVLKSYGYREPKRRK